LWGNAVVKVLDEHERSMAFAEVALGQIRSLRQTAVPRNYEIWYVYATGYNPPLNKIINETLARNGKLTEADLEQIYETYLSHIKTTDRIDKVGARVIGEIDEVMTLLTDALGMSSSYDASLNGASERLTAAKSREQVKAIVETLVKSTREMRETNKALEDRLTLSKNEISNLQQSLEAIRAESLTDPLTGLGNRKYFDRMIDMAVQTALASGEPLSLLMFDIDHFKSFNDSYGHLTGDQVLRLVGMSLKQTIKGQDITARYGGEEFAVVLPNTALRQALTVADHIRREEEIDRRDPRPGHDFGRRFHAEGGRRHRRADRARRRLPLRRQAQRPQPRHLRGRPGIRRRDPEPGGLTVAPHGEERGFARLEP
jgi:diguanylate cyclase